MPKSQDLELLANKFNVLHDRKRHFDNLFWQIPALSLGGQAFLLSIALNSASSPAAKVLSAMLGIFIAFVSLGSFSRIRLYEFTVTNMLNETEEELYGYRFTDTSSEEWNRSLEKTLEQLKPTRRKKDSDKNAPISNWLFARLHPLKSYGIWVLTLMLFISVGIFIIIDTIFGLGYLSSI
jgi:hypothetical protein